MYEKILRLKETLRHIGIGSIVVALTVIVITCICAAFIGNAFYISEKEVLVQRGELNAKEAAMQYNECLLTRVNTVTLAGYAVDQMISTGVGNDEILQFITDQSNYIVATLDPSTTGLYGWINEEYLDGAGWVPDDDYVATERPWYIQTLNSSSKITFVEPYLDKQTNTVMMTVSTLLSDGKSVVAMDVSLDPLQDIVERVSSAAEGSHALVLDTSGVVVAHSDPSQPVTNYLNAREGLGSALAQKIFVENQMQFDLNTDEGNYSVYVDRLQGDWYSVSLINSDIWYRPLFNIIIAFYVVMIIIIAFLLIIFIRLNAKNLYLQKLLTRIDQEEKRGDALQLLSETDRMTGLYDRVNGEHKVKMLLESGIGGLFLVLDIDKFKSFNDTFGHQCGDLVILAVADTLKSSFRSHDILIRLGGDEFGVFAIGIEDQETGTNLINRMFAHLEALEIPELKGEKFYVSVGAVLYTGDASISFDNLYTGADTAMYESKQISGNSLTFGHL